MLYPKLISDLKAAGLTQVQIAAKIGRSQSVISDIARGDAKDIRKSTADGIEALHRKVCGAAAQRKRLNRAKRGARAA